MAPVQYIAKRQGYDLSVRVRAQSYILALVLPVGSSLVTPAISASFVVAAATVVLNPERGNTSP